MKTDTSYLLDVLQQLLATPSPVGDTQEGIALCRELLCEFDDAFSGLDVVTTRKGALAVTVRGRSDETPRAVTAHVDTLGAVVKRIKPNGRLQMAQLGNFSWTAIENEAVTVVTAEGQKVRGSVSIENASHHLYMSGEGPNAKQRTQSTVEIRLDARTKSADETKALGIQTGDFVHFDTRTEISDGFIRSRFLDDKACLACLFAAVKMLADAGIQPTQRTTIHVANYEEVGHGGASGIPADVQDVLALDIAPVGTEQNCDEYSCALCVRDDDGPYDTTLGRQLRGLAKENNIDLRPDVYNYYCSDGDALWKAGADVRVALIGPGVDSTHGYERTHLDALVATTQLIAAWLQS
ncbi:MAG TPA: M42 family metallopeptidase [Abditibacteriaceae bacterium]|jgi:putative aminopeptidase FrvX